MPDEQERTEVTVTINLGIVSISIRDKGISSLDSIFQKCIEVGKKNESLKELINTFESAGNRTTPKDSIAPPAQPTIRDTSTLNSYSDIIEIDGNTVKFTSKNAYDLKNKEAIATLMYFWNKPLQPKDADEMLASGWKKVKKIANYFTDETQLKPHVIKKDDGYILAGNGRRWVVDEIIPKLRGISQTSA